MSDIVIEVAVPDSADIAAESDAVDQAMRRHEAHPGAAVGERKHREVPSRSALGIQRSFGLPGQPGVEFFTRARHRDFERGLVDACNPAMPAERQRGSFDAPTEQAAAEIPVETPKRHTARRRAAA